MTDTKTDEGSGRTYLYRCDGSEQVRKTAEAILAADEETVVARWGMDSDGSSALYDTAGIEFADVKALAQAYLDAEPKAQELDEMARLQKLLDQTGLE